MSMRAAFGIGTFAGFALALGFGAPLAPAILLGLATGAVCAAIAAPFAPHVGGGVAVVHARPAFYHNWYPTSWLRRPRPAPAVVHAHAPAATVVHTPATTVVHHPAAPASRGWFSYFGRPSTPATHVAATPAGGTRTSFAPVVPAGARVTHTRTAGPAAPSTPVRGPTSGVAHTRTMRRP